MSEDDPRIDGAVQVAKRAMQKVTALEERLDEKDARIQELEDEIERLQDRDRLFQQVQRNANQTPTDRAVTLIKTLQNEAVTNRQTGSPPVAEMDAREAMKALHGNVNRELMYPTFERAVDLVDDEGILEYKKEGRSSTKNSRLRLSLEHGELPSVIAGHEMPSPTYEEGVL